MKFRINQRRSRSKLRSPDELKTVHHHYPFSSPPTPIPPLPAHVLTHIFSNVCPHAQDDSYIPSEDSMKDGGCMLCDMRDLSQCALVNKKWYEAASLLL